MKKIIFKSHKFVPFGAYLTHFESKYDIPVTATVLTLALITQLVRFVSKFSQIGIKKWDTSETFFYISCQAVGNY